MNEPDKPLQRKITHFVVNLEAYDRLTELLGNMPFKYAAMPLQVLTEGSRAVFEKPPDAGKIIDNPPDQDQEPTPHDWAYQMGSKEWNCLVCWVRHDLADDEIVPPPGECPGPSSVDNAPKESE